MIGRSLRHALIVVVMLTALRVPATAQPSPDKAYLMNEAFEAAQTAMLTSASAALAQLGARFAAGSDELAGLVRKRQDLLAAWTLADRALVRALGAATRDEDEVVEKRRADVDKLQTQIDESSRDLELRFPAYSELAQPRSVSIAETSALLDEDEAVLLIFVGTRETFVWGLTRQGAAWHRYEVDRSRLVERIKTLRMGLNAGAPAIMRSALRDFGSTDVEGVTLPGRAPFDRGIAHDLFQNILAPLDDLLASKKRVFVIADQPLDAIPFSLLVTAPPVGEDVDPVSLRETQWLVRRQATVTLPSVSSLRSLRSVPKSARDQAPFVGFGAPLLLGGQTPPQIARSSDAKDSYLRGASVNVNTVRNLAPLPQTEGELRQLALALGADDASVHVGGAATKSALQSMDLTRYRIVAFATHGLLAGDIPGLSEPALVFTPPDVETGDDGLLLASEAAKLELAADWVILSACNTAGGDGTPGADGLSGLARAFLYAGARTLLVSHWPVRDDAAARLTTQTFSRLRDDPTLTKAEAFRRSVLAMLTDPSDPTLAHPAIWSPFVMVGEAR